MLLVDDVAEAATAWEAESADDANAADANAADAEVLELILMQMLIDVTLHCYGTKVCNNEVVTGDNIIDFDAIGFIVVP